MKSFFCIYCGKEKDTVEKSIEHIIPKKLGGNIEPNNPLILNEVCKRCNNNAGRFIDAPFIKNWFIQSKRSENIMKFIDLSTDPIVPLIYLGKLQKQIHPTKDCECWLGPTGDPIYHFHDPYPEQLNEDYYVGRPLYLREDHIDNGFAFLFIKASNPVWHKCIIKSFVNTFDGSVLYLGNGPPIQGGRFRKIPEELNDIHKSLLDLRGKHHPVQFSISSVFGQRFLAKLALGFGRLLLSKDYTMSESASSLREFMWKREHTEREKIKIAGTSFLNENLSHLSEIIGWPAGHIIKITPVGDELFLIPIFYGSFPAAISICSDSSMWHNKINSDSLIYILTPGFRQCIGPFSFPSYLAVINELSSDPPELRELISKIKDIKELPPYDI